VAAVAGALNASEEEKRLAVFYAEQLRRSPNRPRADPSSRHSRTLRPIPRELPHDVRDFAGREVWRDGGQSRSTRDVHADSKPGNYRLFVARWPAESENAPAPWTQLAIRFWPPVGADGRAGP